MPARPRGRAACDLADRRPRDLRDSVATQARSRRLVPLHRARRVRQSENPRGRNGGGWARPPRLAVERARILPTDDGRHASRKHGMTRGSPLARAGAGVGDAVPCEHQEDDGSSSDPPHAWPAANRSADCYLSPWRTQSASPPSTQGWASEQVGQLSVDRPDEARGVRSLGDDLVAGVLEEPGEPFAEEG
jgi:hypothetical protein